ncbi:hypothetical protein SLS56_000796 [Neofusicoccum ribis]|uniref:Fungal N-terminal domain-containing protein n=1 Tax=Neofusicoccum ribis TaxID=45134 RepID=A0ABR3TC30_9PEZI
MAEAVGLTASVVTLGEVGLKLAKLIGKLRDAPYELLALSNEVTDFHFLFTEIEKLARERPDSQVLLSSTLDTANLRIKDVQSFLKGIDTASTKIVDRVAWVFRHKSKIGKLQSELRDARLQLSALLNIGALSTMRRMEHLLEDVQLTVSTSSQLVQNTQNIVIGRLQKFENVDQGYHQLQTLLGGLMYDQKDLQVSQRVSTTMTYGADPRTLTKRNRSIFHQWAELGHSYGKKDHNRTGKGVEILTGLGVSLNTCDNQGFTAVMDSVYWNNHSMLEALLGCGADYTIHEDDNYNILHAASLKADVRTLGILAAHGLPGIDIDLRYKGTGETALELFEYLKWDKSAGQIRAFYRMWRQVSLRARLKHGSIPDLRVIEELGSDSDLSEDESNFRANEDGVEILEGDEDEDEDGDDDVFVDALEC